jgi:uncharacterized protein (TIGR03437 family)
VGDGLGPPDGVGAQLTAEGLLPTSLAGIAVSFDGIAAPLISAQVNQVVCIVPFSLGPRDTVSVQIASGNGVSNAIRAPLLKTAVEILAVVNQDGTTNSPGSPAASGDVVTLYAAGLGQTDPPSVDGSINLGEMRQTQNTVTTYINGSFPAPIVPEIRYMGPAPEQVAGITQINVRVPLLPPNAYYLLLNAGGDQDARQLYVGQ